MTANASFDFDLLARLTDAPGPVGHEDRVRDVVRDELPAVDAVRTDAMGNVVATVEGSANPDYEVLVAAHMDEIGLIVSDVDDDGFCSVEPLGGWNPDALRGHPVTVHAREGDYDGVVGINAAHTAAEEAPEDWTLDDAHVFTGLDPEEATEAFGVGDVVTFDSDLRELGECVSGSALDDRAGVYVLLEAARLADPDVTVHYAATVQEEVGLRGAAALGVDVDPEGGRATQSDLLLYRRGVVDGHVRVGEPRGLQEDVHARPVVQRGAGDALAQLAEVAVEGHDVADAERLGGLLGVEPGEHVGVVQRPVLGGLLGGRVRGVDSHHPVVVALAGVDGDRVSAERVRVPTAERLHGAEAVVVDVAHDQPDLVHVRGDEHLVVGVRAPLDGGDDVPHRVRPHGVDGGEFVAHDVAHAVLVADGAGSVGQARQQVEVERRVRSHVLTVAARA